MSLLATVPTDGIHVEAATPLKGLAIVGKPSLKETASGEYINVQIPLYYVADNNNPTNRVDVRTDRASLEPYGEYADSDDAAKAAGLTKFVARFNLKPDWFTDEFVQAYKAGQVDEKEKFQYQINVGKLTRGLFKALGMANVNFDDLPVGAVIGFTAKGSKKEPDRLQIQSFYAAR